jgi:hypothetical protein
MQINLIGFLSKALRKKLLGFFSEDRTPISICRRQGNALRVEI